jgi:hypothetical protein
MNRWKDGKETGDGKITVTMTLTDPAEGRAWAVWLLDHEPGLIPRRPAISYARTRAPAMGSITSLEGLAVLFLVSIAIGLHAWL